MKITPITNLYLDSVEMPLVNRKKYLTFKFIFKLHKKQSKLLNKIYELFILELTTKYWKTINDNNIRSLCKIPTCFQ